MNKTEKSEIVNALTQEFKTAAAVVMCDYRGLTVSNLESLRSIARAKDTKVQVVKNTLASIALANADMKGIAITDTNIFIWSDVTRHNHRFRVHRSRRFIQANLCRQTCHFRNI